MGLFGKPERSRVVLAHFMVSLMVRLGRWGPDATGAVELIVPLLCFLPGLSAVSSPPQLGNTYSYTPELWTRQMQLASQAGM